MKKLALFIMIISIGCTRGEVNIPKPKGYFRLNFPKKSYVTYTSDAPFSFEYPAYAKLVQDTEAGAQPYWNNLDFPQFNGRLHLTYHRVSSEQNYNKMTEAARTLAMKHDVKASAIDQRFINYPDRKVYGMYYEIQGNTASSVQFFLTDSSKHYFRGALYFNEAPKYDSIQPIIKFIKKDIDRMIETFKWKK
ncbi:MAG: gliding motility lipoprotein GldD [Chitinophagaceae bacterium]|nr:MAG: gliding motility lipoprotein GldD [Chitinophagaceae bacterium]